MAQNNLMQKLKKTTKRDLPAFLKARENEASTKRAVPAFLQANRQDSSQTDEELLFNQSARKSSQKTPAQKSSKAPDTMSPYGFGFSDERQQMLEKVKENNDRVQGRATRQNATHGT